MSFTDDQCYAAICARDARFDGMFFTCVRSTGIFCRPSCPSRTPARSGVDFVPSAAAAVIRGFRACKRCGPLAPPGNADPAAGHARRALQLIDAGALDPGPDGAPHVADLAGRLHVSERTLHRSLVTSTGASALDHARLSRARRAHTLLRSTTLRLADVAAAAGFGSERQLHDTVRRISGVAPSRLRAGSGPVDAASTDGGTVPAELAVRRPFDADGLVDWFSRRAVPGVESVEDGRWLRAVDLPRGPGVIEVGLGSPNGPLPMRAHLTDLRDYAGAVSLARRMLDLDADPVGIDHGLAHAMPALEPLVAHRPGVRIPGTPTLREALTWAVAGQQITTVQAREQITRATDLAGRELPPTLHIGPIRRLLPTPEAMAVCAEEWFRGPGARRDTLMRVLRAELDEDAAAEELRAALMDMRGVGPWTAGYALLRGLRTVDEFPPRDAALLAAASDLHLAEDHAELGRTLQAASPWRSYATMHLWHHATQLSTTTTPRKQDHR